MLSGAFGTWDDTTNPPNELSKPANLQAEIDGYINQRLVLSIKGDYLGPLGDDRSQPQVRTLILCETTKQTAIEGLEHSMILTLLHVVEIA